MYNPDWLRYCKRAVRAGLGTDHLLDPEVRVATKRLGSDYGGWIVAVEPLSKAANPIVLSFGLGDDISFDEEISRRYGARVYGFDPTTASLDWIAAHGKPANMEVYPIGIAKFDGRQRFLLPAKDRRGNFSAKATAGHPIVCDVMRYHSILRVLELQHIDVMKLDVEGAEYDVIPDILAAPVVPVQLLIEFHHRLYQIHVTQTRKAVNMIREAGFSLFAVSPGGQEMSFIRGGLHNSQLGAEGVIQTRRGTRAKPAGTVCSK
jgi:FkbM family methyltransferase